MGNQAYNVDWSAWSEPLMQIQQMGQATGEKLARECVSFYSDAAAQAVRATQTMQRINSPEDFWSTQLKLLTQQGEKTMEHLQSLFQILQDSVKEHSQWTEEKVSSAIKTAGKVNTMPGGAKKQSDEGR